MPTSSDLDRTIEHPAVKMAIAIINGISAVARRIISLLEGLSFMRREPGTLLVHEENSIRIPPNVFATRGNVTRLEAHGTKTGALATH